MNKLRLVEVPADIILEDYKDVVTVERDGQQVTETVVVKKNTNE